MGSLRRRTHSPKAERCACCTRTSILVTLRSLSPSTTSRTVHMPDVCMLHTWRISNWKGGHKLRSMVYCDPLTSLTSPSRYLVHCFHWDTWIKTDCATLDNFLLVPPNTISYIVYRSSMPSSSIARHAWSHAVEKNGSKPLPSPVLLHALLFGNKWAEAGPGIRRVISFWNYYIMCVLCWVVCGIWYYTILYTPIIFM